MELYVVVSIASLLGLSFEFPSAAAQDAARNWTYVSPEGENQPQCINGGLENPCRTLNYTAEYASTSTAVPLRIEILYPVLDIENAVTFTRASNVTIVGRSQSPMVGSVLRCNSSCIECGLVFNDTENISISLLNITGCGVLMNHGTLSYRAALVVHNCHNFILEESNLLANIETGLSLVDTFGNVEIRASNFKRNGVCTSCIQARGLSITFTIPHNTSSKSANIKSGSFYEVRNCHIENNSGPQDVDFYNDRRNGGGVSLRFENNSTHNNVMFIDITLSENFATWGGGMFIQFRDRTNWNQVTLKNVKFFNNSASKGGGGMDIGYTNHASTPPITNHVSIDSCNFTANLARFGAGTAMYSSQTTCVKESDHNDSALVFSNSIWERNTANFSPAVDISPFSYDSLGSLYFPHPKFKNCTFIANNVHTGEQRRYAKLVNSGSFTVYGFEVQFEEYVEFREHQYTALHVTEGTVAFLEGTVALFLHNSGAQGGALSLYGSSSLHVYPNTTLNFYNNTALDVGGAIYHHTQNHHDFISSRTCFIKYCGPEQDQDKRPVFNFQGNRAAQAGNSMYATTFLPCYFEQINSSWRIHTVHEALEKIACFNFDDDVDKALATSGKEFDFNGTMPLMVVPGEKVSIPLTMRDELNNTIPSVYRVVVEEPCHSMLKTDRNYTLPQGNIGITGSENIKCNLNLNTVSFRESSFQVELSLQQCPPGFYFNTRNRSCECSAYSKTYAYNGVDRCHDHLPQAYIRKGYWMGYNDNETLLTAPCPRFLCLLDGHSRRPLPQNSSHKALENVICRMHRMGWLCGRCQANFTTYYHSPDYQCGSQELCFFGFLFYFLSELVPIVVMFVVIVSFDVKFTTGTASGLVFFAQVIDTVSLNSKGNVESHKSIDILSTIHEVIYGLFNFNFFNIESLSFCLWKDATLLDVIAFRYMSVVFAFILLLILVLFLKYCTCKHIRVRKNRVGTSVSVIHGMSAVLIMCYAQCTNISFQILTKSTLRGAGGKAIPDVSFFGGIQYFQKDHLMYALPACFCLVTIVAIPPLLLLVYPSYMTLFSLCRLNETRPLYLVSRFFVKLKPFLDSFQGCYRDKLRFFSGLYFVSRVAILAPSAFLSGITQSLIVTEIITLLTLGAHALFQPFQKTADNINNGLILLNIALINSLTLFVYTQGKYDDQQEAVTTVLCIRLILLYLPIICMCGYLVKRAVGWVVKKRKKKDTDDDDYATAGSNIDDSSIDRVIDHNYLPFQELDVLELSQREQDSSDDERDDW